jgi:hypothetical protein
VWEYVKDFGKVNRAVEFVLSSVTRREVFKITQFPICDDRVIVFSFKCEFEKKNYIQGVPGGKDNILGGHSIGHSKQKLYMNMCPIANGFRDRAILVVWLGRPVLSFPPARLREGRSIFWEVIVSVILSKKTL